MNLFKPTRRDCPVCGQVGTDVLFRQQFSEISDASLFPGYDVVACRNCGFCFAADLPEQASFDQYYREMSKYEHQDNAGQASEFETRLFPALAEVIRQIMPYPEARVLEVGCANGGLLYSLKQAGYQNLLGVDPSPVCAQTARELYAVNVITSSLSNLDPALGPFDLIILVSVLEHIVDLTGALAKLHTLLSPGGRIYVDAPDATRFASSLDAPFQEFSIEHINYFSSTSLANLMRMHGFAEELTSQITYQQTDTHTGYAIRMVFSKTRPDDKQPITFDRGARPAIERYIAASKAVEHRIHQTVDTLAVNQTPLIVWGVGTHTQRLLATSELARANVVAFVDSNPHYQGKQLLGKPIISPDRLGGHTEPILVSSRIFQDEIVDQIRSQLMLTNEIITLYED